MILTIRVLSIDVEKIEDFRETEGLLWIVKLF
jgi:hypothetical protein